MRCSMLLLLVVFSTPCVLAADPAEKRLSAAEQKFAAAMSNASLVGAFTTAGSEQQPPRTERYDLGEVRRVGDGLWVFPTRIRYGTHDVTLPITLPVRWAGDTAVIVVDKIGLPGMGVFTARVMIHDGRYAGYWEGTGPNGQTHGGHLFGALQRSAKAGVTELQPQKVSSE